MNNQRNPAGEIAALLKELDAEVITREQIVHFRKVNRGRTAALITEFRLHRTTAPGLLAQLGVIATAGTRTVLVEIYTHGRDGKRVRVRTEQRQISGLVTAGAALPGGSPGWDRDGALSPITRGGQPAESEPLTDAWHVAVQIRADLEQLRADLEAAGYEGSLVDIALADPEIGQRIVSALRSYVDRARIAAGYDAPLKALGQVVCPLCESALQVREDASSAVRCTGRWEIEGPARRGGRWPVTATCGMKWEPGEWVRLLDQAVPRDAVVPVRAGLHTAREGAGGRA